MSFAYEDMFEIILYDHRSSSTHDLQKLLSLRLRVDNLNSASMIFPVSEVCTGAP